MAVLIRKVGTSGIPPAGRRPRAWVAIAVLASAVCLLGLATGCSTVQPRPLRPEPIAYADTLPIAEPPEFKPVETTRLLDAAFVGEFASLLSIRRWAGPAREAANLTHFDDVVNSAWFEHRNGHRRLTPSEVARGPTTDGPDTSRDLRIIGGKAEGRSPGFIVLDARGDRYLFKFDPAGFLHLASAAEVISSRLLHAAGYNAPENYIAVFDSARLVLDPAAKITSVADGEQSIEREDIQRLLARADTLPDGRFLAMASKFVPGVPKGPFRFKGRRSDDPNDYYYHEHRRELRGLYVLAAWLNHVDMRFTNSLDAYVEPGYLRHYLIDFGATLGSATLRPRKPREGQEHNFDLTRTITRLFSLGFYRVGWEGQPSRVIHPSIGWLPVEEYRPEKWKANWPNAAFARVTPRDGYWGAKLVGSFTDEQIRAAVAEGKLQSDFAADTLAKILSYRRYRTIAYWYSRVTPIENVEVENDFADETGFMVSFDDLGIRDGVWRAPGTTYRWDLEHRALGLRWRGEGTAAQSARQTLVVTSDRRGASPAPQRDPAGDDSIATLDVTAYREGAPGRAVRVYLAWDAERGVYRVVGLEH